MEKATARVPTTQGSKYVQQLCKHWSHKLDVETVPGRGTVRFNRAVAVMVAELDAILITLEAEDTETLERIKGVLASHLDRFAFREAPLAYDWQDGA